MKLLNPGHVIDGFEIQACLHAGGMAHIYTVQYALSEDGTRRDSEFPMAMKIPRMTAGDGAENIVSFEVEHQILPALSGVHVPRFVAAGDLSRTPYLVMEYVQGSTLETWCENFHKETFQAGLHDIAIARVGAELAHAAHSLHKQNVCHLDLKPANVLIRPNGKVVLLDFGLSCHAHYPDLLAEEMRKAVGSPAWIAPDMRQRLWMDPVPPRKRNPKVPAWLQEVILKCLHPEAAKRYPSAAHLAMDLGNPDQIRITERGQQIKGTGFKEHFKRWLKAAGMHYQPSPLPSQQIKEVPILMVALPHADVSDATWYSLREAVDRSLGIRPGARLACVTVISPNDTSSTDASKSESSVHRMHLTRMQQWSQGLDLQDHQVSFHVLEASDVAHALVTYAESNEVSMIIMGAATHGLQMQRFVATVPIKVAMNAPCTVILVKQDVPFEFLGTLNDP
ncbi:MAG: serine/threonine protein kinase [Betaproteobacteria bacterium]|nr:serine/threonine protein kinase [Betaproteobacteria bacterium]